MRLVYQNAQRVVVYLGASNPQIDCLFDWMIALDSQLLAIPRPHTISTWENQWFWIIWHLRGHRPPDEIRAALSELLQREWFSRIWVLQEAALARSAIITCGLNEVNSRVFVVMPSLLNIKCGEAEQSRLDILPGLLRANSWWGGGSNQDLSTLIQKFGRSEASDPRDIIFALLGLSGDTHSSELLRPNYQINLEQTIQQCVAYFLIQTHDLPAYTATRVQVLPKWSISQFLASLPDLALEVFRWAAHNSQDGLLYDLLISQRKKQDGEPIHRYMNFSDYQQLNASFTLHDGHLSSKRLPGAPKQQHMRNDPKCGPPITTALKNENQLLLELLLQFPDVDIETPDSDGNTPLSIAIGQGNTVVADLILRRSRSDVHATPLWVTVNDRSKPKTHLDLHRVPFDTPLWTAVKQGDSAVVEAILQLKEASIYELDSNGDGLMNIAARRGDDNVLQLLLNKTSGRGLLSLRGSDGLTSFESALVVNSPATIRRLLEYHNNAVLFAVRANQVEFLRRILEVKPSLVDRRTVSGSSLANATEIGKTRIMEVLLDKGADVNLRDSAGIDPTPLWIAASCGDLENVRLLVERGADIDLMARRLFPALDFEPMAEILPTERVSTVEEFEPHLMEAFGDSVDEMTLTKPIWIAASNGHADVVKFLIQHGADIETRDSDFGMTPFWRAAQQDRPEVMRVLIEGGADIRARPVW